jgi:hypothetical protein
MLSLVAAALGLSLPLLPSMGRDDLRASHGFSAAANWLIPGHVLLGANPTKGRGSNLERVMAVCDGGCGTFVSLQAELPPMDSNLPFPAGAESYSLDVRACADRAQFMHFPIEDLRPASNIEYLAEIVAELGKRVRQGDSLYIHCFAGRGRTGLVAACLLGVLYEDMGAEEALDRVGEYYRLRASYGSSASRAQDGMSPETEPQRQQVRDFFAALGR